MTALHHAAHEGHIDVAAFLLKHGASVDMQTKVGVGYGEPVCCAMSGYALDCVPVRTVRLW